MIMIHYYISFILLIGLDKSDIPPKQNWKPLAAITNIETNGVNGIANTFSKGS